jgi:hypothetical protein
MRETPLTINHRGLGALVHQLRQDLDVHELLSRHHDAMRTSADARLWAYLPDRPLGAAALAAGRIYGSRRIGDWHSIPAALRSLPEERANRQRAAAIRRFGHAYGQPGVGADVLSLLGRTCADFTRKHAQSLAQIQAFAEQEAAAPAGAALAREVLPPDEEFEVLHTFARSFHRLLASAFAAGSPPRAARGARDRLRRLLQANSIALAGSPP